MSWIVPEVNSTEKSTIKLVECTTPPENKIFRETINKYHSYVKYKDSPTRNIRFLAYESVSGNLVGAVGLSSATIAVSKRDLFIGWDNQTRMRHLGKLANNSRFCLIRDNFTIKNVGSMTLKQLRLMGQKRWLEKYEEPLILLETFVLEQRESPLDGYNTRNGSIYLSDNWIEVGLTKGNSIRKAPTLLWQKETGERGRLSRENPKLAWEKYGYGDKSHIVEKTLPKMIFVKPLVWNWKSLLLK
jgi:hypothetical protein